MRVKRGFYLLRVAGSSRKKYKTICIFLSQIWTFPGELVRASRVQLNPCVAPRGLDSHARLRVDVILDVCGPTVGHENTETHEGKFP